MAVKLHRCGGTWMTVPGDQPGPTEAGTPACEETPTGLGP